MPYNHTAIEKKWQQYWVTNASFRTIEPKDAGNMPKSYILDMFPYPSGAGLHVGHPEDIRPPISRRATCACAATTCCIRWGGTRLDCRPSSMRSSREFTPRITTEQNIANFRKQIQMLGLSYDWEREVDTTDPQYYRWTQWIFVQLFNSYFDPIDNKAKPISHLENELQNDTYVVAPDGRSM